MDNFLHLVSIVADGDDGDSALVYGEDDLVVHEEHDDALEGPMNGVPLPTDEDHTAPFFDDVLPAFTTAAAPIPGAPTSPSCDQVDEETLLDDQAGEHERMRYLRCLVSIETSMRAADERLQHRLAEMRRILTITDPIEQLSEYVPLITENSHGDEDMEIVSELLHCAQRLTDERDIEVALLGAFVFLSDPPRSRHGGIRSILPAVVAMIEGTSNQEALI